MKENSPARHKRTGETVDEYIAKIPNELAVDAVGLWQIVPVARDAFGLEGASLVDFIRRSLLALFARGAKPAMMRKGTGRWIFRDYGDTPESMATAIITEWQKLGCKDPEPFDSLWFVLPRQQGQ